MPQHHTPAPWTDDEAGFIGSDGRPIGQAAPGPLMPQLSRIRADRALMTVAPVLAGLLATLTDRAVSSEAFRAATTEARDVLRHIGWTEA